MPPTSRSLPHLTIHLHPAPGHLTEHLERSTFSSYFLQSDRDQTQALLTATITTSTMRTSFCAAAGVLVAGFPTAVASQSAPVTAQVRCTIIVATALLAFAMIEGRAFVPHKYLAREHYIQQYDRVPIYL